MPDAWRAVRGSMRSACAAARPQSRSAAPAIQSTSLDQAHCGRTDRRKLGPPKPCDVRAARALNALAVARITAADGRLGVCGPGRYRARRRHRPSCQTISIPPPIAAAPFWRAMQKHPEVTAFQRLTSSNRGRACRRRPTCLL
ncbi:hypothetical protein XAP6164_3050011 [Xanthomonas phaseoli pv. phaseoli]|nr:hypothetical protein XAP6164_3050011 [Xanthomonas phaseoli pv. phaseoli]